MKRTNFKPIQATNDNTRAIPLKRRLNLSSQWTIFDDHYCDCLLHVHPTPIVTYFNYLINYGRNPRNQRHTRIYHIHQRELNQKIKCLTPQSQFVPWYKDDIIEWHKHTILHLPHLMINRGFYMHTSKFDPLVVYNLLQQDDFLTTNSRRYKPIVNHNVKSSIVAANKLIWDNAAISKKSVFLTRNLGPVIIDSGAPFCLTLKMILSNQSPNGERQYSC